ncbi:MAG: extracellular solute-binding protein [Thermomicrobiales bacterium]
MTATLPRPLRVALLGDAKTTPLYSLIPAFTARTGIPVEIIGTAGHAALNALLATDIDRFDLVSTHIKYAPSQAGHLLPLDDLLGEEEIAPFKPIPMALSRMHGRLLQLPRNTDTRLLACRRSWLEEAGVEPPATWADLAETATRLTDAVAGRYGYAFCCRPSGLFGEFFELMTAFGGKLVTDDGRLDFTGDAAISALTYLHDLHVVRRVTPPGMLDWDFGDVTQAFLRGEVGMIGDWPSSFPPLANPEQSAAANDLTCTLYPSGPAGRFIYSGSHSFAITRACRDVPAAKELLLTLTSAEGQLIEARNGSLPTRADVAAIIDVETTDPEVRHRLALLDETMATAMLSYPPLATYPRIEAIAFDAISGALRERFSVYEALAQAQARVEADPAIVVEIRARSTSEGRASA